MNKQWISLEQASEITGASQAIILDTLNKYQNSAETELVKAQDEEVLVDKKQIISLFPSSASIGEKEKIPGTVFRWFDELRRAYETSMQTMFKRVEMVKDQHKDDVEQQYQARLKEMAHQYEQRLEAAKAAQDEQLALLNRQISKLEKDTEFYQQQVMTQQNTISQLNNRYDTVILALKDKHNAFDAKDITPAPSRLTADEKKQEDNAKQGKSNVSKPSETWDLDRLIKQGYQAREEGKYEQAVELFKQAALAGAPKAMGALGRSYFIGEGVVENRQIAIAWLYLATEHGFAPAEKKVAYMKTKYPEQYEAGLTLAESYRIQIKLNKDSQVA